MWEYNRFLPEYWKKFLSVRTGKKEKNGQLSAEVANWFGKCTPKSGLPWSS